MPVWKNWGTHVLGLPAEAKGGNPGEYSSESPEGLTTRQDYPGMPKPVPITGITGKWAGGGQTGGWGREVVMFGTT